MQETENTRRKQYQDIECVPMGYANGVAPGFPFTDREKDKMIEEAKEKAKAEAQKIVTAAKESITNEKLQAMNELKTHVAGLSLEIAEKIIRTELSSDDKQKALAEKMADDINMN